MRPSNLVARTLVDETVRRVVAMRRRGLLPFPLRVLQAMLWLTSTFSPAGFTRALERHIDDGLADLLTDHVSEFCGDARWRPLG